MLTGPMRDAMAQLEDSLRRLPGELPARPQTILMISGHWEAPVFTVQTNPNPSMIYDFGGFPEHTYRIQYPAPGAPAVAARMVELLSCSPAERTARLERWELAPSARFSQPREDHLIPLMVVVGAAEGDRAVRTYHEPDVLGFMTASSFRLDPQTTTSHPNVIVAVDLRS